ncbi:hypothetical protein RO3G_00619 [Rhizopus delemar RA 99-880]|uniref:Uncharacterized protein n=1 Tax=Rhizopus delemar (strain RA 99-880 / ATCC MYA-4621 / FGSC 9543 / NRRL 43880) TaxID=246409 RepID=I1BI85_RHIO9|nr:hypothetical protein RO3G_00619 [Rhizopus delemar RA 99-880]|eukprot:EIE75915.1 hypothetical protein RO3G_00619 [Rhizopus delemar RA 99-880]
MLSTIFTNVKKQSVRARDDIKFKYSQSEIDYIVKDITSFATREIPEGYCAPRPDCIIISHNGIEVGTIEIKPLSTWYKMSFATEELDENGEYKLIQHDTVMIPSFTCNAQQMETFLETIFSFKNQIMESLVDESEKDKPCIYKQHSHIIKPTIAFETKAKND